MPLLPPSPQPAIVIGGGISGLACAFRLQQSGISVRLLEAGSRPGGMIATQEKDGFRFELGPQSFLATEAILPLIETLGLKDQVLRTNPCAPRYIFIRGRLVAAPLSPPALLTTPLFGARTKWRLLTEIFRHTRPPEGDETIAAFMRRKFGEDLLNHLVAPFVSGIYAGDPERLSLRAAFPKLREFEEQYGSVLRGMMKSRPTKRAPRPKARGRFYDAGGEKVAGLCSFRDGMHTLPGALAARLGGSLRLESSAMALRQSKANGKPWFELDVQRGDQSETLAASVVVIATPANVASQILQRLSEEFPPLLSRIPYAPVAVLSAGYRRTQFRRPPYGFGFLVPRGEGLYVLGTVFSSSLFPGRAPERMISFASFAGGATDPDFCRLPEDEITEMISADVARVLGITGRPVTTHLERLSRALPQYNLGHTQAVRSLEALTATFPGLFLTGNYLAGPSIGSCVEQANRTADAARAYLSKIGQAGVEAAAHA